jgi:hypothetical protein
MAIIAKPIVEMWNFVCSVVSDASSVTGFAVEVLYRKRSQ